MYTLHIQFTQIQPCYWILTVKALNIRSRRSVHMLSFLYNVLFNFNTPSFPKNEFSDCHDRPLRSSVNNLTTYIRGTRTPSLCQLLVIGNRSLWLSDRLYPLALLNIWSLNFLKQMRSHRDIMISHTYTVLYRNLFMYYFSSLYLGILF